MIILVDENMQKKSQLNSPGPGSLSRQTTLLFYFAIVSRIIIYYFESHTKKCYEEQLCTV